MTTPSETNAEWLADWRRDIEAEVRTLLPAFEANFGYPPGDNGITTAGSEGQVAARRLAADPAVAATLPDFYTTIGEAVLSDIGNAYFIHPAVAVLDDLTENGPVRLADGSSGVFFASDGGGIHFAIASDGTVHRSAAASRDSDFVPVAADLQDFLNKLRQAVVRFVATGQPGDL